MKGDFTRVTFRPRNHYSAVLQQQGRVQLDADWNEQVAIGDHLDRTRTRDLVGGRGAPCDHPGFALTCGGDPIPSAGCAPGSLQIEQGRLYVDGILVENDGPIGLGDQPDLPGVGLSDDDGRYLVYLDVWEEHLTALERPELREVALGGPDTATRTRTVWQARLEPLTGAQACSNFGEDWVPAIAASTGRLAAQTKPSGPTNGPCIIPPGAGFRRLENQLYRVEIHDGSQDAAGADQTPTWKWSRDNGTVVLQVSGIVATVISVVQPARDAVLGFAAGDWVEISDEGRTLRGEPGILVELADAQGTELTAKAWSGGPPVLSARYATTVRRWESAGALEVQRDTWIDLEDGVQVEFDKDNAKTYRTGDYWLIPARSADVEGVATDLGRGIEWPTDQGTPTFQLRHGTEHRYCPIAILERETTAGDPRWMVVSDCRTRFPSLTDLTQLEYVGGDGQEAMPGDPLPQPLKVGVWNGGCAIEHAVVRFSALDGGKLTSGGVSDTNVDVPVDDHGLAACTWLLNDSSSLPSQRAWATLLDDHGDPVGLPVDFTANLSIAAQVAYDPEGCDALAGEVTVQDAVGHLAAASSLAIRCGDGQEALREEPLPELVEVLVSSACGPTEGATVEFAAESNGRVAAPADDINAATQTLTVVTGSDGRASAVWQLDPKGQLSQRLEVKLADADGPLEEPTAVCFTGRLSVGSQVQYDGGCDNLALAHTVTEAIDTLCDNAGLYYVSGDGQEGAPGKALLHSLQVRVANGAWPMANRRVTFAVITGGGTVQAGGTNAPPGTAITDANGIAESGWTLGQTGPQRVQATLGDNPAVFAVGFNAQFADTGGGGAEPEPGIHVAAVRLNAAGDLINDLTFPVDALVEGVDVVLSDVVDPASVDGKPVLVLTVELPFPQFEGSVVGFMPLVLRGDVSQPSGELVRWFPATDGVIPWLMDNVSAAKQRGVERVLARLRLVGSFIWGAGDPSIFVDGDSFGAPSDDGRTEILRDASGLMSGDGRRGGDFEMWFWLVQ